MEDRLVALQAYLKGPEDGVDRRPPKRKHIADAMERDREKFRQLREEGWARPVGEKDWDEFASYRQGFYRRRSSTRLPTPLMRDNQLAFLALNGRSTELAAYKRRLQRRPQVFVLDIEDSFIYLDTFLEQRETPRDIRRAAEDMDDLITKIGCRLFFYRDMKGLYQPHIDYFASFDDDADLGQYRFDGDRLGRDRKRKCEGPGEEWSRERAYRSRLMRETLRQPDHLAAALSAKTRTELEGAKGRLDEACKRLNSLAHSIFAVLADRPDTDVFVMAPRSLSRLFAMCSAFGLGSLLKPGNIYSSLQFGTDWCLRDIRARYEARAAGTEFVVCGAHEERTGKVAKALGWTFVRVRGRKDLMAFAQRFDLVHLDHANSGHERR